MLVLQTNFLPLMILAKLFIQLTLVKMIIPQISDR
jgi:hypothetical protein